MDAYDRCTNLGKKNLADIVATYGRGRELFGPPTKSALMYVAVSIRVQKQFFLIRIFP